MQPVDMMLLKCPDHYSLISTARETREILHCLHPISWVSGLPQTNAK
jgi:hypothetical protein